MRILLASLLLLASTVAPGATGVVKSFDASKGTGVITSDEGHKDFAVQASAIEGSSRVLKPGQKVTFDIGAQNVKVVAEASPANPASATSNKTGTVKSINGSTGNGYITPADGSPDIFMHLSQLQMQVEKIKQGQKVLYDIGQGTKGKEAINVRPEK